MIVIEETILSCNPTGWNSFDQILKEWYEQIINTKITKKYSIENNVLKIILNGTKRDLFPLLDYGFEDDMNEENIITVILKFKKVEVKVK